MFPPSASYDNQKFLQTWALALEEKLLWLGTIGPEEQLGVFECEMFLLPTFLSFL
jgi:hypothetical protein